MKHLCIFKNVIFQSVKFVYILAHCSASHPFASSCIKSFVDLFFNYSIIYDFWSLNTHLFITFLMFYIKFDRSYKKTNIDQLNYHSFIVIFSCETDRCLLYRHSRRRLSRPSVLRCQHMWHSLCQITLPSDMRRLQ